MRADRVGGEQDEEHERVGVLRPRHAEGSVERRREHRDACEGHHRHPPAHSQRQCGDRCKRGAVRAQSAEHHLELRRDQQRGGQAQVSHQRGMPSLAGAAVRGPHALTVPAEPGSDIIKSERVGRPQV
jgi:hypothetical protein